MYRKKNQSIRKGQRKVIVQIDKLIILYIKKNVKLLS